MYSERMENVSWAQDRGQALQMYLEMLTAPFWGNTCRFLYSWHFGATVFLLESRQSRGAESIELVEKLHSEGGGSAVHVHFGAQCSKVVNQHFFLILIITNKMGAFKEQRDSCFAHLNEQAERCKKTKQKGEDVYAASNETAQPKKKGPELSGVIFSTK